MGPLSRNTIVLFSREPNDDKLLYCELLLFEPLLFKNGELQSRSRDEENVDELYPELLNDEPRKYDDVLLSLIDIDDCSLMLLSRNVIIDGIGVCIIVDIVSELRLFATIEA